MDGDREAIPFGKLVGQVSYLTLKRRIGNPPYNEKRVAIGAHTREDFSD
jgi:hypothetical protein